MSSLKKVLEITSELKDKLGVLGSMARTDHIALLGVAAQIHHTEILARGLVVSESDKYPTGLEAIAIANGYVQR
jgi:hypothetical protein